MKTRETAVDGSSDISSRLYEQQLQQQHVNIFNVQLEGG